MTYLDTLLQLNAFDYSENAEDLYNKALKETYDLYSERNKHWKAFIHASGSQDSPINDIPPIPVSVFKHASHLTKVSELATNTLSSSGTSGRVSQISIDSHDSKRQKITLAKVMSEFIGEERLPAVVFDIDPKTASSVSARQAAIIGYTRFASDTLFLLELNQERLQLKPNWREILEGFKDKHSGKILIIGFTYVLYQFLQEISEHGRGLDVPENSKLIHIGGWKKLESMKVSPTQTKDFFSLATGIDSQNIHDVYGFTELMGVSFVECGSGWKHVPNFVKVRVHHSQTLAELASGDSGLLSFVSPIPRSYLGANLLTDDVGFLSRETGKCSCGLSGQKFRVTGRRPKAEIRGCGDILSASMESSSILSTPTPVTNDVVQTLFPNQSTLTSFQLMAELKKTRKAAETLATHRVSEVLEVIDNLREHWRHLESTDKTGTLRLNGLGYLVEWASPSRLRNLLDTNLLGGSLSLDGWSYSSSSDDIAIRSTPKGLVSQWVSANVPLLGMFPTLMAWLTGNSVVMRVSSTGNDMSTLILNPLKLLSKNNKTAEAILNSTLVLTFDRSLEEAHHTMSKEADVIIAWGGLEATNSISAYPAKASATKLVFGPRTSFAVVFGTFVNSEPKSRVVARRAAADVFVFDQIACASPHTIYFVSDTDEEVLSFANLLAEEFNKRAKAQSSLDLSDDLVSEIAIYRRRRMLDSIVLGEIGSTVVVPGESHSLPEPIFGRTVNVIRVSSVEELRDIPSSEVQSVGVAGSAVNFFELAQALEKSSVKRFPQIGRMTNFEDPWDGVSITRNLVNFRTLGGPA